ncbi:unnamed protein product [Zymoseptoria tritici ST99CH_1A5]|uniref:Nucleolar protein 12 n=2 Tax=Zymoseptoria tritici TaxID=1047171 RepID=A0A1X7RGU7_ZYMT9|nr:unnamed protein product [Zymoseptoria tritici ST99CH_3D7]SMR45156.1 unnamed protein product [Zymoseptoria tritici ST99CH_3D1]SMY20319.1 unnamed protein product [Zymoseptoria tritici ST99CH_1A5]
MAAEKIKKEKTGKVEKSSKKPSKEKKDKKDKKEKKRHSAASAFALLADDQTVDPTLSSLFAVKQPAVKAKPAEVPIKSSKANDESEDENDEELSSIDGELEDDVDDSADGAVEEELTPAKALAGEEVDEVKPKRKRKRKDADEELEDAYMNRLAREEEKDADRAAKERGAKRQKQSLKDGVDVEEGAKDDEEEAADDDSDMEDIDDDEDDEAEANTPPPKHETETAADDELQKANRTVFLGNVSTSAIISKVARKALLSHLASFFTDLPETKKGDAKPKVESLRFRSTPFASAIPKKAAFAKKELMDATTKSTNAYAVYSTPALAREACTRLNGTSVLARHMRVDSVAHPAKVDNHRCIFIGNLGFVDDETNIQDANEADGREIRKRGKEPADVEEGLWRTFSKCGTVESVRVIRDSTTRVGKGIAYVQFTDENAVEAALLYNEKKFPPMLPRKLRVTRAKAIKRNAKPGSGRPTTKSRATGYQRKYTSEEASQMGRTSKLFGRAAAAQQAKSTPRPKGTAANNTPLGDGTKQSVVPEGIRKPENFIFEGHRASAKGGKSGLKLGGKKKGTKVTGRSASFKAKKRTGGGK